MYFVMNFVKLYLFNIDYCLYFIGMVLVDGYCVIQFDISVINGVVYKVNYVFILYFLSI